MEIRTELVLLVQVLFGVIAWLGKRTLDRIEASQVEVLKEVQVTNGTVIRLEQAITDHDRLDDQRFGNLEKRIDKL
jgi:hypothetical protein